MKRLFVMMAIGMTLLTLLVACGPSSSEGESSNKDTPSETVEREFDLLALTSDLIDQGVAVGIGDDVKQPFFSVAGQKIIVHQEPVQVFTYASSDAAQADADLVRPTGSPVGISMVPGWLRRISI